MKTQVIKPAGEALEAPAQPVAGAKPAVTGRLLFVDYIRVFLTILVVLHHLMITYAGSGSWYYVEGRQDLLTTVLGTWFCATNQAYFMGFFLLISAYFVPGAYDRKGAGHFLKDRLIRLGIPLAAYSWLLRPPLVYAYLTYAGGLRQPLWSFVTGEYFRRYGPLLGGGPLWFIETLLIFSAVYLLWRLLARPRPAAPVAETRFPGGRAIALFALFLGLASFLVRLVWPCGWCFGPLNLQFPYFAQYIALFIVGLIAFRRNWLLGLPDSAGRRWLVVALALVLVFPIVALVGGAAGGDAAFRGGWHWQALALALWESYVCVGMCIGLVYLFRRLAGRQSRLANWLVPNAYIAYLIHEPVIIAAALVVQGVALYPLLKWAALAPVALALSFGLGSLIRRLPYTDRVL